MMKPGPEKSEESAKKGSSSMTGSGELRLRLLLETKGLAFAAGKAPSASWTRDLTFTVSDGFGGKTGELARATTQETSETGSDTRSGVALVCLQQGPMLFQKQKQSSEEGSLSEEMKKALDRLARQSASEGRERELMRRASQEGGVGVEDSVVELLGSLSSSSAAQTSSPHFALQATISPTVPGEPQSLHKPT